MSLGPCTFMPLLSDSFDLPIYILKLLLVCLGGRTGSCSDGEINECPEAGLSERTENWRKL